MHFTMLAQNEELMHLLHKKGSRFCSTFHYIDPIFHLPSVFPYVLSPSKLFYLLRCYKKRRQLQARALLWKLLHNWRIHLHLTIEPPTCSPPHGTKLPVLSSVHYRHILLANAHASLETSPNGVDRFVDGQKAEPKCNNNGVAVMPDVDGAEGGKFLIAFRAESEASASWKDTLGRRRSQFRTISIASIWAWLCLGSFTSVGKANQMDG